MAGGLPASAGERAAANARSAGAAKALGEAGDRPLPHAGHISQIRASPSPQSTDLTHKMMGSYFLHKQILDASLQVAFLLIMCSRFEHGRRLQTLT